MKTSVVRDRFEFLARYINSFTSAIEITAPLPQGTYRKFLIVKI